MTNKVDVTQMRIDLQASRFERAFGTLRPFLIHKIAYRTNEYNLYVQVTERKDRRGIKADFSDIPEL